MNAEIGLLGRMWLNAYHESIQRYVQSGRTDIGSLCEAAYQLKSFLEREPGQADKVRSLALQQIAMTRATAPFDVIALLGEVALRASICGQLAYDLEAGALREILLVPAFEKKERPFDALDHLDRCRDYTTRMGMSPFGRWAAARESLLRADLAVDSFELGQARDEYRRAYETVAPLLADDDALEEFFRIWKRLMHGQGSEGAVDGDEFNQPPRWEAKSTALRALHGAASLATAKDGAKAIHALEDGFEHFGRVPQGSPLHLIPAMAQATDDARSAFCENLRAMARDPLGEYLAAIGAESNSEIRAMAGDRGKPDQPLLAKIDVAESLAGIEARLVSGSIAEGQALWNNEINPVMAANLWFPTLFALGQLARLVHGTAPVDEDAALRDLMLLLGVAIEQDPAVLVNPRYRSMLDPAIGVSTQVALDRFCAGTGESAQLSALLALQRSQAVTLYPPKLGRPEEPTTGEHGVGILADTLKRIQRGVRRWPEALVIVTQGSPDGMRMITCNAANDELRTSLAGDTFPRAMAILDAVAREAEGSDASDVQARLEEAGRSAMAALPPEVRDAIANHRALALVPDYSADHDTLPFELLHTGDGYLLAETVIARFTSLHQLATSLERDASTPGERRALVIGIAEPDGYEPLEGVEAECEQVRGTLSSGGFDSPLVLSGRVTLRYLMDRMSYVDVLHISSHGESALGTERLILQDGTWLETGDLERHPQTSLPFTFLNSCELGRTRFLGGGRGRGIAYTLSEMGAPAVLANTTRVYDDVCTDLATEFYGQAAHQPVGEALRRARATLLGTYSAAEVARLVLLGNPYHALPGVDAPYAAGDPVGEQLDKYFDVDATQRERSEALTELAIHGDRTSPRSRAARLLVLAREEAMDEEAGNDVARLDDAVALAEALDHLPSAALFKYKLAKLAVDANAPDASMRARAARPVTSALARKDPRWRDLRDRLMSMSLEFELSQSGVDVGRLASAANDEPDMLRSFIGSLFGIEELYADTDVPDFSHLEDNLWGLVWNAVILGAGTRLESVPERLAFVDTLVDKLVDGGYLAEYGVESARPMLAAVLTDVWSERDYLRSSRAFAVTQAKRIEALLADIGTWWSPPEPPVTDHLDRVGEAIEEAEQRLAEAGWYRSVEVIDDCVATVVEVATSVAQRIALEFPDRAPSSALFIAGLFLEKNTVEAAFQDHTSPLVTLLERVSERFADEVDRGQAWPGGETEIDGEDETARWLEVAL